MRYFFLFLTDIQKVIMPELDPDKRYYTISEVAKMFEVSTSLIRFWENEFPSLKPHKTSKGDRRFTVQNIEQFDAIYELVKNRGFTLDGAKQEIKRHTAFQKEKKDQIKKLNKLKKGLLELKEKL